MHALTREFHCILRILKTSRGQVVLPALGMDTDSILKLENASITHNLYKENIELN